MPATRNLGAQARNQGKIRRAPQAMVQDKAEAARLLMEGYNVQQIVVKMQETRKYRVTDSWIYKYIEKMKDEWRLSAQVNIHEVQMKELAKIDNLERTFWEAWYVSWNERKKEYMEQVEGWREKKVAKIEKEYPLGDVQYLQGVEWCITQRCKIYGLEAPTKTQIDWRVEAKKAGIEDEQAAKQFEEMVNDFARKLDSSNGTGGLEGSQDEG
jgi:hypothetical protein